MGWWSWLTGVNWQGEKPNANPPAGSVGPDFTPGDPDGVLIEGEVGEHRALATFIPSPWSGWPSEWSTPNWDMSSRYNALVDVAWDCLDLNASVLSAMPVYRLRNGQVMDPVSWMTNPDPVIYASWAEFAKQLFWDFQLGEAFVLPVTYFADGFPMTFRVVPPWMIYAEMAPGARRRYWLGGLGGTDVSEEILHIRYKSSTDNAHGIGPLEVAGGRMLTAGLLARYVREFAQQGGLVNQSLETDQDLTETEAQDLLNQWLASRTQAIAAPTVLDSGAKVVDHQMPSPRDAAMLELAQFTESRIAVALGVPPFLMGLPSAQGESLTYSNVSMLFDFHDRASLRPKATHVMQALSNWALVRGQSVELNRDEYSRPAFNERADAWTKLVTAGIVTPEQVQQAERFVSATPDAAPLTALTGGQ